MINIIIVRQYVPNHYSVLTNRAMECDVTRYITMTNKIIDLRRTNDFRVQLNDDNNYRRQRNDMRSSDKTPDYYYNIWW